MEQVADAIGSLSLTVSIIGMAIVISLVTISMKIGRI